MFLKVQSVRLSQNISCTKKNTERHLVHCVVTRYLFQFNNYCVEKKLTGINQIDLNFIVNYIRDISRRKGYPVGIVLSIIRTFIKHLFDQKIISENYHDKIPKVCQNGMSQNFHQHIPKGKLTNYSNPLSGLAQLVSVTMLLSLWQRDWDLEHPILLA